MDAKLFPDNPFWTFSLKLYARPGVAPACLALQGRRGLDVNVLLYCLWLGAARGVAIDAGGAGSIVASVRAWNDGIVVRLRVLRTALKGDPHGAVATLGEALRTDLKRVELDAERIEQQILFTQNWSDAPGATPSQLIARANVWAYLESMGIQPDSDDAAQLGSILAGLDHEISALHART